MQQNDYPNPFELIFKKLNSIEQAIKENGLKKDSNPVVLPKRPVNDDYVSKKEAAELASLSVSTIDNLRRAKVLKPYKFGKLVRFKRSELIRYLESRRPKD